MPKTPTNPKIDAYLAKAAPFAQPILTHLRTLIHKACPDVVEEIKWSRPFFVYNDVILCNISAFKAHCSFGFWGAEIGKVLRADGVLQDGGMGSLGRITGLKDLPPDKQLLAYLRQAVAFIESGQGETFIAAKNKVVKAPKPPIEVPSEFTTALNKNKAAATTFQAFSPSCQREYVAWIASAKQPATRDQPHRAGHRPDRRGQAAQLEVRKWLSRKMNHRKLERTPECGSGVFSSLPCSL